jgi:hypothetical protein
MAPLPPNNTARYRVRYFTCGLQHSFQIRSNSSPLAIGAFVTSLYQALGTAVFGTIINTFEFAAQGSNIFNAVLTGAEGVSFGSGTSTDQARAYEYNFIGRSTGGKRVRMMIFGAPVLGTDYRYIASENSFLDAARGVLNSNSNLLQCIDGLPPVWKSYVNAGSNAYWQKELRS